MEELHQTAALCPLHAGRNQIRVCKWCVASPRSRAAEVPGFFKGMLVADPSAPDPVPQGRTCIAPPVRLIRSGASASLEGVRGSRPSSKVAETFRGFSTARTCAECVVRWTVYRGGTSGQRAQVQALKARVAEQPDFWVGVRCAGGPSRAREPPETSCAPEAAPPS